ncbi:MULTISPECIES: MBL fold metallo-hydrolase [unclassified Streptomyces]|uniref:MBL fold metallo-hydrolase n=1 Tax=unclassified Streptomyces TaxID=2593676 RepID=UPI001BAE708F|nr:MULTISPECIES: MBL fold metallo-hydrolase [unclassified Streptomyces]MDH6447842.1 glyoxylase-like metal-dependent hydrolase (beta-lactamase superfamily II) [Streptomyces sp. SAI-119]MDH6501435.1 glyoxylase-like metal-dependent hydrolase (beta-lactamase superfamily II) [Streptomyces sp. SAI-149]QUC60130.1 MBL fold metallo-hydrolase [Streptomyces sp. A2-16]
MTTPTTRTPRLDRGRWAQPGPETVEPGVHRIPLPLPDDGLRAVNVYVLEGLTEGLVLVDGGWSIPESRTALEDALTRLGHDLGEISHVLVTHIHRDHYTQAVELRRLLGSQVYLGAGERCGLELLGELRTDEPVGSLGTLRRAGAHELAERVAAMYHGDFDPTVWEAPDRWLREEELHFGETRLAVVPTPGHTQGHVVYLDRARGLLFSGDHVLPHITPSIGFELGGPELPLGDYLNSLHLMTTLADARLLPAHGPVGASVHERVAELLAHHDDRLSETLTALGDRTRTAYDVAGELGWTRRRVSFTDLGPFDRMLAVNETAAHLDVLVARGGATCTQTDGVNRYTAR